MFHLKQPIHIQQITLGYCLPACAQMALAQLGIDLEQSKLAQILGTQTGIGTPFSRIKRLDRFQIDVQVMEWVNIDSLIDALANNVASIVALTTTPGLSGWGNIRTQHTVLLAEVDNSYIKYYDPALPQGPVSASRDEFLLAWCYMSEQVAFLSAK